MSIENPEYTIDDINDRLTAVTIQKDETARRLLSYIKPLIDAGVIKKSGEVKALLPTGISSLPNEWRKLGVSDSGSGGGDLFIHCDPEGEKIYKRVKQITNIMSNCSQQFNDLVAKRQLIIRKAMHGANKNE